MGIYMVNRKVLGHVPNNPYGFDDLMLNFLANKSDVAVRLFKGYWLDIGRPDDYIQAINEFDQMKDIFLSK